MATFTCIWRQCFIIIYIYLGDTSLAHCVGLSRIYKAALVLFRPQADRQKTTIYNSGPPRNSSLSTKVKRFAFKACLRCMGGDLSAVVASASRRPRA